MGNGRVLAVLPMQYSPLRSEIQLAMVANTMCVLNKLNEGLSHRSDSTLRPSPGLLLCCGWLMSAPAQQPFFEPSSKREQHKHKQYDQQQQCQGQRSVEGALSERQEVPEPAARSDELADDGAGKRESDGNLKVAKGPCGHGREINLAQQHRPAAAQRLDPFDEALVDLLDPGIDGEEEQHRYENECHRDLGGNADPEPDHEERRQNNARYGIENRHRRVEDLANP